MGMKKEAHPFWYDRQNRSTWYVAADNTCVFVGNGKPRCLWLMNLLWRIVA